MFAGGVPTEILIEVSNYKAYKVLLSITLLCKCYVDLVYWFSSYNYS